MSAPILCLLALLALPTHLGKVAPTAVVAWEGKLGVSLPSSHRMAQRMVFASGSGARDIVASCRRLAAVSMLQRRSHVAAGAGAWRGSGGVRRVHTGRDSGAKMLPLGGHVCTVSQEDVAEGWRLVLVLYYGEHVRVVGVASSLLHDSVVGGLARVS